MRKMSLVSLITLLGLTQAAEPQANFEIRFAQEALAKAQALSLERGREHCGYIGVDENGRLAASKPRRGRADVCRPKNPPRRWQDIVASYHTHGTYSEDADSEVPSSGDILADANEGIDGYLITPGGRVWYIDGVNMQARQLCGVGCMRADPNFQPEVDYPVRQSYTVDELLAREGVFDQ
ncbi:MAG: DUF4329 domain-containing protein [Pseudomonadota bacterium]